MSPRFIVRRNPVTRQWHVTGSDRVAWRMALWAARSVEHLAPDPRVESCNDVLERWLADEATTDELKVASAAYAATSIAYAAFAHVTVAADYAATSIVRAAVAGSGDSDDAIAEWVDRYLDAWGKTASDEGCMAPEDMEAEYVAFVESLDFTLGGAA